MKSNNFRLSVLGRVLLLVFIISALMYCYFTADLVMIPLLLFLMLCAAVTEFVFYGERTNREFTDFLLAVKNADFTAYNVKDKRGKSFSGFKNALNIIMETFQTVRIDKEAHYIFLQTVVEHLDSAVISFDSKGEIKLVNEAAKQLFQSPFLENINDLRPVNEQLFLHITSAEDNTEPLQEVYIKGEKMKLLVRFTKFRIQGVEHRLASIQNIKTEIEYAEIEAWEQLLHVLTHEIMNSITPISSLSATLKTKLDNIKERESVEPQLMDDMAMGLQVIGNRSIGLIEFVNQYKSLITLPKADIKAVPLKALFNKIRLLTEKQLKENNIELKLTLSQESNTAKLDSSLIEQVLLNLINNAADALIGCPNPVISLSADTSGSKTVLTVTDNGKGIPEDEISRIFIPFFTTKKKGTGIGLSISRQIMRLHNGNIHVQSAEGLGTTFTLEFQ